MAISLNQESKSSLLSMDGLCSAGGLIHCMPPISEDYHWSWEAFRGKTRTWWLKQRWGGGPFFFFSYSSSGDGPSRVGSVHGGVSFIHSAMLSREVSVFTVIAVRQHGGQASCPSSRQETGLGTKGKRVKVFPFSFRKGRLPQGIVLTPMAQNYVHGDASCNGV